MSPVRETRAGRLAPKSLLLFGSIAVVVLWVLAFLIIEGFGDSPADGDGQALVRYFAEDEISLYAGGILFFIGSILFIWWMSALYTVVADLLPGSWLPAALYGSGVGVGLLSMGFVAPQFGAAFAANDEDAQLGADAAQALWWAGDGFFIATAYAGAAFFISVLLIGLRNGLLPSWTGALMGIGILLMIVPGINWLGVIFGIPISTLLIGIFMRVAPAVTDRTAPTPP